MPVYLGVSRGSVNPLGKGSSRMRGPKQGGTQLVFFFQRQGSVESVDLVAGVVLSDYLSAAKAVAESWTFHGRWGDLSFSARRGR